MIVRIPKKDGMHRDLDVKPELVYDLPLVRQVWEKQKQKLYKGSGYCSYTGGAVAMYGVVSFYGLTDQEIASILYWDRRGYVFCNCHAQKEQGADGTWNWVVYPIVTSFTCLPTAPDDQDPDMEGAVVIDVLPDTKINWTATQ